MARVHVGSVIAERYRLVRQIAVTRQSELYEATDERLNRQVVLKFLTDSSPEAEARALQEARLAAEVGHPNVVAVYDVAEADGQNFIVLEHVPGVDLKTHIANGEGLPLPAFFRLANELGNALDAVHERGILHRDVKPQNVIVAADGGVKLVDFGIARPTEAGEDVIEGTLDYLAPERLHGEPASVASDVYALGAVLYEALTGRPPYPPARTPEEARAWREKLPPPPSTRRKGLPPSFDDVLLQALRQDPAERPTSAGRLVRELESVHQRHAQPTGVVPLRTPRPTPPPTRRLPARRSLLSAGVLAVLILTTSIAALVWAQGVADPSQAASGTPVATVSPTPTSTPSATPSPSPTSTPIILITVPSFAQTPIEAAREQAKVAGFPIEQVTEEETRDVAPGLVLRQEPPAGKAVAPGTPLRLTVAKLPTVDVPDVTGRTQDEAKQIIETAGLVVGNVETEQTDVAKPGTVLRQNPPAGERRDVGTGVDLVVATEPLVRVPKVIGLTLAEAEKQLEGAGLRVGKVETQRKLTLKREQVIAQSQPEGAEVKKGTEVDLTVELAVLAPEPKDKGKKRKND